VKPEFDHHVPEFDHEYLNLTSRSTEILVPKQEYRVRTGAEDICPLTPPLCGDRRNVFNGNYSCNLPQPRNLTSLCVCFFVLCNRHCVCFFVYVVDTGSTGPRARIRVTELGVTYLTFALSSDASCATYP